MLMALVLSVAFLLLFVALLIAYPNAGTIKLGIFALLLFGGLALAIIKGLWVRLEPPQGLRVRREDAPGFFALLEELRKELDCAPFHEVLLVADHNAAVVQVPRLGIFGWHKNYLLVGLPLLQGLAPEEFKAVLAHEFAHSSRGHGRFSNWLYRLRQSWARIVHEISQQQNRGSVVLTAFLKFFWPRFNGRAFVLSRANEYEADDWARRLTSARDTANALLRVSLNDRFLDEKFWPGLYEKTTTEPAPPLNVFRSAAVGLRAATAEVEAAKWVQQAFLMETSSADTHPALKDRLKALGVGELRAHDLPGIEQSAGEVLFGERLAALTEQLSSNWSTAVAESWKTRHEEARKLATELEKLDCDERDAEALWKKAVAVLDLKGDAAAAELVEKVLTADPNHMPATFVKARHLLANDNGSGVGLMERVMAEDELMTEAGCQLLYGFYTRTGQREKLRGLEERVDAFQEKKQLAQQERNSLSASDTFLPAELPAEVIARLQEVFANEKDIHSVAAARKQVQHFAKIQLFVMALKIKPAFWKVRSSDANQKIVNRLMEQIELPGHLLFFVVEAELAKAGKKVFQVPGSTIYTREE